MILSTLWTFLRSAARDPLGLCGLLTVAVAVVARLRIGWRDRGQSTALWVLLAVGATAFGGAFWSALPHAPGSAGVSVEHGRYVLTVDRSTDTVDGLPGGLFYREYTNHMMRNSSSAGMWSMAGNSPFNVGWVVHPPRAGRYALRVLYASEIRCEAEVRLEERTLFSGLARTTADRLSPRWFDEGAVDLQPGANHLWFHSEHALPNIAALRLTEIVVR